MTTEIKNLSNVLQQMLVSLHLETQYESYESLYKKVICSLKNSNFNCFDPFSDNYKDYHDITSDEYDCYFARRTIYICSQIEYFNFELDKLKKSSFTVVEVLELERKINEFSERYVPIKRDVELLQDIKRNKAFIVSVVDKKKGVDKKKDEEPTECSICFDDKSYKDICDTSCNHKFCVECVGTYIKSCENSYKIRCPMCRRDIESIFCYRHDQKRRISWFRDKYIINEPITLVRFRYNGSIYAKDNLNNVYELTNGLLIGRYVDGEIIFDEFEASDDE